MRYRPGGIVDLAPFMEQARKQTSGYDGRATTTMAMMLAEHAILKRDEEIRRRYWRRQHSLWSCT